MGFAEQQAMAERWLWKVLERCREAGLRVDGDCVTIGSRQQLEKYFEIFEQARKEEMKDGQTD